MVDCSCVSIMRAAAPSQSSKLPPAKAGDPVRCSWSGRTANHAMHGKVLNALRVKSNALERCK